MSDQANKQLEARIAMQGRLQELRVEEMLKNNIIVQAEIHYGPYFPTGTTFRVITGYTHPNGRDMKAAAYIVAQPSKTDFTKHRCVNDSSGDDKVVALESLLEGLQGIHGVRQEYYDFDLELDGIQGDNTETFDKRHSFVQRW